MDTSHLRVALFADVQNLYHSSKASIGANLSYEKLQDHVADDRILVRSFAYVLDGDADQTGFVHSLEALDYTVKRKPVVRKPDGTLKGNWDIGMTLDIMTMLPRVDVVCIATGDGAFTPVVDYVRERGIWVEVFAFHESISRDLREAADEFSELTEEFAYGRT